MQRLNLCIDMDGTITEPYYWLTRANEYFKTSIQPADVNGYEIHKILEVTQEDFNHFYDLFGKVLHKEAEIRFGAREVIAKSYQDYHKINFVTAREEKMRDVSLEWLSRHQMPMDSIHLLGCPNKVGKATELESDIFIEDSYDNAIQLAESGFDVLLLDCNYNKGGIPSNVMRVNSWFQIANIIETRAYQVNYFKFA